MPMPRKTEWDESEIVLHKVAFLFITFFFFFEHSLYNIITNWWIEIDMTLRGWILLANVNQLSKEK